MKVFAVLLHSHLIGKKMSARHIRGDTEMEPLAEDLNFDFDYQDLRTLSEEREIRYVSTTMARVQRNDVFFPDQHLTGSSKNSPKMFNKMH